jgi:hypothetical protein
MKFLLLVELMVSIYDKNFRVFPRTGEEIEVLQGKKNEIPSRWSCP